MEDTRQGQALVQRPQQKSLMTIKNLPPGLENVNPEDFVLPRVAIAQDMSKVVKDQKMKRGSLYNTLTEELYQNEKGDPYLKFIPILMKKNRIKWHSDIKKGAEHMSLDGIQATTGELCESQCPFIEEGVSAYNWGTDPKTKQQTPPACTPYLNFLSLLSPFDSPIPIAVSFGSTSYVMGKRLISMAMMAGGTLFSRMYSLTTEATSTDKGDFFIFKVLPLGKPDEAFATLAATLYPWVSGNNFKVDMGEKGESDENGAGKDVPF